MTLRSGKLPQALLAELLATVTHGDPRVIVGPGIGRDAAVIDLGDRLLVAKTDPITFATSHIGWYAVHVNANDVACMGARPAWFLATALLPPGSAEDLARSIFPQLGEACAALGVELVGGHTEITAGVERAIVAGAMLGEATRDEIITGEGIVPGDGVLMTKGIAIEGTALLATDAGEALMAKGVSDEMIGRARRLLFEPGISVVPDAQALRSAGQPRLLHDATEGGLATALHEVAVASGMTVRVDLAPVRVLDETRTVCDALALDALGLLASGTLVAVVPRERQRAMQQALDEAGIASALIGRVEGGAPRVIMGAEGPATPLPMFPRDELARFFDETLGGSARGVEAEGL